MVKSASCEDQDKIFRKKSLVLVDKLAECMTQMEVSHDLCDQIVQ